MESSSSPTASTPKKIVAVFSQSDIKNIGLNKLIAQTTTKGESPSTLSKQPSGKTKITLKGGSSGLIAKIKSSLEKALNNPIRVVKVETPDHAKLADVATNTGDEEEDDDEKKQRTTSTKGTTHRKFIKIVQNEVITIKKQEAPEQLEDDETLAASSEEDDDGEYSNNGGAKGDEDEDEEETLDKKALTKIKLKQARQARVDLDKCKPELKFKYPPKRVYKRKRSTDMDESPTASQDEDEAEGSKSCVKEEIRIETVMDEDEEEEEEKPKKVYKKRGRKSKAELEEIARLKALQEEEEEEDYDYDEYDDDDEEAEVVQISTLPTKRGRVPKPRIFQNYVVSSKKIKVEAPEPASPVVAPATATPKKRGRKPKPKEVPEESSVEEITIKTEDDEVVAEEEDEQDVAPLTPRRRGRPRILRNTSPTPHETQATAANERNSAEDAAACPPPPKKRPGRPCKQQQQPPATASPKSKVKEACGKRGWSEAESPSTSGEERGGDVDEPSKRPKLEAANSIDNENVTDEGVVDDDDDDEEEEEEDDEEDAYTKQYRLLVSNLVKGIRLEMARSESKPQSNSDNSNMFTCAICKAHIASSSNTWNQHKQQHHNNLAWRTTDAPLNLDNTAFVMTTLNALYPSKPFKCNVCGTLKKSVLGFLTHKVTCNKTDEEIGEMKEACKGCDKWILPHQLVDHEKRHRVPQVKIPPPVEQLAPISDETPTKRNAAQKATMLIQKVAGDMDGESQFSTKQILKHFFRDVNAAQGLLRSVLGSMGCIRCLFPLCESTFSDYDAFTTHFFACSQFREIYFICKFCPYLGIDIAELQSHLNERHSQMLTDDADFEENDETQEEYVDDYIYLQDFDDYHSPRAAERTLPAKCAIGINDLNAFWKLHKFTELLRPPGLPEHLPRGINTHHYCRMLDFCRNNYSASLFTNYAFRKANWFALNKNYLAEYLPTLKLSIEVCEEHATKYVEYKHPTTTGRKSSGSFKRYKLFEACVRNDTATLFCGGPISALAWAPTPFEVAGAEQVLAVAVQQHPDTVYTVNKAQCNKSIIQLWNFGALPNDAPLTRPPVLEFCIAHHYGGVFAMEWCPSGCYEVCGTRLGLLALTATDANVYCYSIAHGKVLRGEKMLKPKPIFKLVISTECETNFGATEYSYPTCLSWSKAKEHKFIAVGYTNGCFAMFNLHTANVSLKTQDAHNVCTIFPYLIVKAHRLVLSAIRLSHLDGGDRFVVTSSFDRSLKLWDLQTCTERHVYEMKRATGNQLFWPVNAITVFQANEASSSNLYLAAVNHHLTNFDYNHCNSILYSTAPAQTISGHDWGLVIYQGNDIGEIVAASIQHLYPFLVDVNYKPFLISCASLLLRNKATRKPARDYVTADNHYRIKFSNYNLDRSQNLIKRMDKAKKGIFEGDVKTYPLQAVTALSTNNNRFSFLFTAAGYKAGFVRVYHSNF